MKNTKIQACLPRRKASAVGGQAPKPAEGVWQSHACGTYGIVISTK